MGIFQLVEHSLYQHDTAVTLVMHIAISRIVVLLSDDTSGVVALIVKRANLI
jgi:hypothetical protein